ncbi:MAG TPA: hypothetical protein PLY68_08850 [Myxococcota bacterium]|nr:hypothetical protein [Myxococcota bacterium]HOD07152.1 hypothetical protein [Myxococcota bacterium]HPB51320.1 hypothetical protein [Myxococcota bacterium]HQP96284.1 hypothetical protein [Myxococcota bacterium]
MTRKVAFLFVAVMLIAPSAMAREGDTNIGFQGQYIAYGNERSDGGTRRLQVPTGGIIMFAEYSVLDYIALGGQIEYGNAYMAASPNDPYGSSMRNFMGFSGSFRAGYPFLKDKNLDVYIRLNAGYGIYGLSQSEIEHGWVARAMPGVMYATASGFTVFAEIGWAGGGFIDATDSHHMLSGLAMDFGIGWKF